MNEPIKIDLDAIEATARAAGDGEWRCYTPGGTATNPMQAAFLVGPRRVTMDRSEGFDGADAAHIVAANPTVVLELVRRLRAAEARSAAKVEQIPADTTMLAVFTDLHKELLDEAREFGEAIQARCGPQTLVAFFSIESSLAALNEEQMRQAGWMREPKWQPMSEAPPFPFTGDIFACGKIIHGASWCSGYWQASRSRNIPAEDVSHWRHETPKPLSPAR